MKNLFEYISKKLAKLLKKKSTNTELLSAVKKPEDLTKESKEKIIEELSNRKEFNNDLYDFVKYMSPSMKNEVYNKVIDQRMTSNRLCFLLAFLEKSLKLEEWEKFFQRLVDKPTNNNIGCIIKHIEPSIREEVVQKLADRIKEIEEQEAREKNEKDKK